MPASLFWNDTALEANRVDHSGAEGGPRAEAGGPVHSARALAIVHCAMADAYAGAHRFGGGTAPFPPACVSAVPLGPVDPAAALAGAAHAALRGIYARQAVSFDNRLAEYLQSRPDGASEPVAAGLAFGAGVARALLDARAHDGADDPENDPATSRYTPLDLPGTHDVDPLNPRQGFYGRHLGLMRPFALTPAELAEAMPPPPPRLSDERYLAHHAEVYDKGVRTGGTRTEDETEAGLFWAYDGARLIGTPPRLYNQLVRQVCEAKHPDWTDTEWAALLGQINIAMADAGIVAWRAKYFYNIWRPILGVRRAIELPDHPEAQQDPLWEPLGAPASNGIGGRIDFTPNFPAFPSGHATFGTACFTALREFRAARGEAQPDRVDMSLMSDELNGVTRDARGNVRPAVKRPFCTITQMIEENLSSRVFLGVHWRFDGEDGRYSGAEVGCRVASRLYRIAAAPADVPAA